MLAQCCIVCLTQHRPVLYGLVPCTLKGLLTFINSVGRRQCSVQQSLGVSAFGDGAAAPECLRINELYGCVVFAFVCLFVCLITNIRWV
jgi:hypothetical protein